MKAISLSKVLAVVAVLLFSTFCTPVQASHIPGANITYTCNPANPLEYTFTLTAFVRCPSTHPTVMSSGLFTMTNGCGLTNPIIPDFNQVGVAVDVNQLCPTAVSNCSGGTQPGIWRYTYQATIILPANCANWQINYNLCCRDAATNMGNGSGNDMSTYTSFNSAASPCNNSPVVTSAPIPYACTNTPFTYCLTTADPEGDSLYYRMVNPATAWGTPIPHLAGFTVNAPLNGFVLNPLTGCFSFTQPTVGNYVVAIAIDEYNSAGVLISTIIHDFQVQVLNCTNTPPINPIGAITNVSGNGTPTSGNSISACMGESFCFDVIFQDAVNPADILTITTDGTTLFPGATFMQTGSNPATGRFCWTVVPGNTGNVATFIARDNGCPVMGTNAFGVNIDIIDGVYAGPDASVCGGIPVQLTAIGGTTFTWSPALGLSCTNCANPIANPPVTTTYTVTGVLGAACSNTDQVTVNVENVPPTATITGNVGICGAVGSNTLTASGGTRFLWSTGATTSSISVSPASTSSYSVIVTNFVGGCEAYDTVSVVVSAVPDPNLSDVTICNGSSTTLTAEDGGTYLWSTGATTDNITVTPLVTTNYYVTVTVGTCAIRDTAVVTVTPTSAPVMNCPSDTTIPQCVATYTFDLPIALDYCAASPCISSPIADVFAASAATGAAVAGAIPTPFTFAMDGGVFGPSIGDGGNDMYDGGNYLNTNLGTSIPYTNGAMSTHAAFGGGSYFTQYFNNLFVMAADLNGVTTFSLTGNNGADGSGTVDGFTYTVTVGCMDYDVYVKRVHSAFDPSINQVIIIPGGSGATHSFAASTDNTQHDLTGLGAVDRLYYLLFAGANGYAYTNAEIQAVVLNFLVQANTTGGGVAQAPVTQTAGLPSGSVFPLGTTTLSFQATGVSGISTCSYDVTVTPTSVPVMTCRTDTTVAECASDVSFTLPTATDLCGAVSVVQIGGLASGSTFPVGTNTITFRATNSGGQTTDCSFDIIVTPGFGPVITCRTDTTVSICNSMVTFTNPAASDPCNAPCTNSPIASVATAFATNGTAIAATIPSPYNFTLDGPGGATSTYISDGGSDMYDAGNYLNTNLAASIPYTGGAVLTHAGFGGGSYFTHKFNNLFVMAADLNPGVTSFSLTGNNGADGSGVYNGFTYTVTVGCMTYDVFVKRVNSAFDPSINQVVIIPDGSAATHSFATTTDNTQHDITGLAGVTRLYYMLFAGTGGFAYTDAQIQAAVVNFLTQVNAASGAGGGGVTVAQIAGLASGSTFPVGTNTVTFRATSLVSGLTADCSFDIVVQPRPTASVSGTTALCAGSNTTLTAAGGLTYLWNTGATTAAVTVSPVASTPYYVTVADAYNCTDSASIITTISTVSTAPTMTAMPGTYCPNTTMTLTAAGGTAGTGSAMQWYTGANGTGTWLGTGGSLNVVPTDGQTFYVRREGTCNNTADAQVTIDIKDYIYALNATTTNTYCTDNAGWHHFFNGNEIILSIQGDLSGIPAGFPEVTIWDNGAWYQETQGPFTPSSCAGSGLSPGEERFEMERSWNAEMGGGTLAGSYNVRFYYNPAERTAIETAAINHMATYPACGYTYKYPTPLGFYWFKNTGATYSAPDYDGLHLGAAGGTTPNGVNYGELAAITSFSGGTGAIILIPDVLLNVKWLYFTGETNNKTNFLRWATETEQNTNHFNIQRSQDGVNFVTIGAVAAQGNASTTNHYTFDDENPFKGENYYRLELVKNDGDLNYSNTVRLLITDNGLGYNFYPNPTNDIVYYQYETTQKENLRIEVLDVLGKQIVNFNTTTNVGINNIAVDLSDFPAGTYMVRVHHTSSSNVHIEKVIKNKF